MAMVSREGGGKMDDTPKRENVSSPAQPEAYWVRVGGQGSPETDCGDKLGVGRYGVACVIR